MGRGSACSGPDLDAEQFQPGRKNDVISEEQPQRMLAAERHGHRAQVQLMKEHRHEHQRMRPFERSGRHACQVATKGRVNGD